MFRKTRWSVSLFILFSFSLFLLAPAAMAKEYPSRPITIISPYPPGGTFTMTLRAFAEAASNILGEKIIVTPMPGAGTAVGIQKVMNAKADGYTLLMTAESSFTIRAKVRKLRFTMDDFIPISTMASSVTYLAHSKSNPKFSTFEEFVAYAKAHPGDVSISLLGLGGTHHAIIAMMEKELGIKLHSIPFDGGPQAVASVLGNHIDIVLEDVYNPELVPMVITNDQRFPTYPNTPTFKELGYPNMSIAVRIGMYAPKDTPEPIVRKLEAAFVEACKDQKYQELLASLSMENLPLNQEQTMASIQAASAVTQRLIDDNIMQVEE